VYIPFPHSVWTKGRVSAILPLLRSKFLLTRLASSTSFLAAIVELLRTWVIHWLAIPCLIDARSSHVGLHRLCLTVRFLSICNIQGREWPFQCRRAWLSDIMTFRMACYPCNVLGQGSSAGSGDGFDGCCRGFLRWCSYGLVWQESSGGALAHAQNRRIYEGCRLRSGWLNRLSD
jgi:hypothetical protein